MSDLLDRIHGALVGLKMPRALEALDHTLQQLEKGEITAIEAINMLLSEEYLWVDGIYSGLRATEDRLCAQVVIRVNPRGEKRFLAIEDGVRESTQSWRKLRGFAQLADVIEGVDFINGTKPSNPDRAAA